MPLSLHFFAAKLATHFWHAILLLLLSQLLVRGDEAHYVGYDYTKQRIYHSPQTPGYTCWVGAWQMPDESMMICFTQATGPLEGRPKISDELRRKLSWPPADKPQYDFTGLDLNNIYMRSTDQGRTWTQTGADPFKTPAGQMSQGGPQISLPDGVIIRAVFGYHLPLDSDVPKTGFLQRSRDGGKTWGDRQVLFDPDHITYRITRLRWLRDGRMIGLGGIASIGSSQAAGDRITELWRPLLIVSDDQGATWSQPIEVVPESDRTQWGGEEWDVAELSNGDLVAVFRRLDPQDRTKQARWQAVLKKSGNSWTTQNLRRSPLPHSGHPELLATREGPVIHFATTGTHWTVDAGTTWHELPVEGIKGPYRTRYYPHGFQAADGTIYLFAHVGSHDPYGKDEWIEMDKLRIKRAAD